MSEIRNKEIGGYLEMETFLGKEYFNDLYRLNLGRTSFVWLLQNIEHERVFLPKFICDSVNKSALDAGFELVSYGLDENLTPLFDKCGEPGGNDILYLVNFYGQLSSDEIKNYKKTYPNIIVDNAQAFYDAPVEGVHTLYSARKFFGLTDGAYVATPGSTNYDSLPADKSQDRVRYLVGRMEDTAREHYSEMLAANETFSTEIPRKMSKFTQNMLRAIDYEAVKKKRCENYEVLSNLLPNDNPFNRRTPECPFAYPFFHEDGVAVRKYLAENNIFIPTLWKFLIEEMPEDSLEHQWSANILSLPIDQRYSEEDLKIVADAIRNYK